MSYGTLPRCPPEICSLILDSLDDMPTLSACALVCRAWQPRARFLRFRTLHLHERSRALLCDDTSTILPYIRELVIDRSGEDLAGYWPIGPISQMRLAELTSLESLSVISIPWPVLDEPAQAVLCAAFSRIKCLHISARILDIVWILSAVPLLEDLAYSVCDGAEEDLRTLVACIHEGRIPPTSVPPLKRLARVRAQQGELLDALRVLKPDLPITTLVLKQIDDEFIGSIIRFTCHFGAQLEYVSLEFFESPHEYAEYEFIAAGGLSHCKALQRLFIAAPECTAYVSILEQIPSPHLQKVSIRMMLHRTSTAVFDLDRLGALFTSRCKCVVLELVGWYDTGENLFLKGVILHHPSWSLVNGEGRLVFMGTEEFHDPI